jgi:hypothetical protein
LARSPLFDYYDPYGLLEQQAQMGLLPPDEEDVDEFGMPRQRSQVTLSDLMPAEQRGGMLRSLSEMASSGLQTAGYIFDTPGALVRGVLAGKPLSFLGGSDERVTGRDLMRQYGLVGDTDTWGNFLGGLAGEVLLDPLTYANPLAILGRGALTKGVGVPLRKAGLLRDAPLDAYQGFGRATVDVADDVARLPGDTVPRLPGRVTPPRERSGVREYLRNLTPQQAFDEARFKLTPDEYDEAVRRFESAGGSMDDTGTAAGLMSVRLPGTSLQYDVSGGAFGDWLASSLDDLGEWSKRAPGIGPVTRGLAAAFDSQAGYTLDPDLQMRHRIMKSTARRNEERLRREFGRLQNAAMNASVPDFVETDGLFQVVPESVRTQGFRSRDVQNALADWLESGGASAADGALAIPGSRPTRTSGNAILDAVLENVPEFRQMRNALDELPGSAREAARARALKEPGWTSRFADTRFFPRQMLWFGQDEYLPDQIVRGEKPYARGDRMFNVEDNFGRSRQMYTDIPGGRRTFREMTAGADARQLQDDLLRANNQQAPGVIDRWFEARGLPLPYQSLIDGADDAGRAAAVEMADRLKLQLSDFVRGLDRQYAGKGVGVFDTPVFTDAVRYATGQARNAAGADQLIDALLERAADMPADLVGGGSSVPLVKAAEDLGFDSNRFAELFRARTGADISTFSIDKRAADSLRVLSQPTRLGMPESKFLQGVDSFTRLFKAGALAWPSFHTRNAYSNLLAMGAGGSSPTAIPAGYRAAKGNLGPIGDYLESAPIYRDLDPAARQAKFAEDAALAGIGMGNVMDDVAGIPEQSFTRLTPGLSPDSDIARAASELLGQRGRTWGQFGKDFFTVRGVGMGRPAGETRNPLLRLNDAVGTTVEDTTRLGMFANLLRQGYAPTEAGDMVRRALIDYSPSAFSAVERDLFKRLIPFYSFQRGQVPAIVDNILYRPGGMQGQSVRAVSRASEPTEERFVPEQFRRSSAIPLPFSPAEGTQRYLTKIDLPWESTFNLFTPGIGSTLSARLANTVQETGSNLLGQFNPLIKAPIEYATDRQLYSGRNLSDAYSVLESQGVPGGRALEQIIQNFVPFGTRALGLYRQLNDDRLTTTDALTKAAFNTFAGLGLKDVDEDSARDAAARQMLKESLQSTPNVRTYENIAIDDESLARLPPAQRDLYLLYRIIQSDAAKRSRQRKKAEGLADPMAILGIR